MDLKSSRIKYVVLATCVLLLGVIFYAQIMSRDLPQVPGKEATTAVPIGGPFRLTTQSGRVLSDKNLKGEPFAVFFGFTNCPEICPTTLSEMSVALTELGNEGERFRVLFITVDPSRDTPEFLARYLQSFDHSIVGLTGTEAEIAAVGKEYRAYWEKVPTEDGEYTMNHTASIFLIKADGSFFGTIRYGEEPQVRLAKLQRLLREGASKS